MAVSVSTAKKYRFRRILGKVQGNTVGPTIVFVAGIHGNEKAGVLALQRVLPILEARKDIMAGTVIGLAGNLEALEDGVRFRDKDLNRMWSPEIITGLLTANHREAIEDRELVSLYRLLMEILEKHAPPFYIIDLHTTSGPTCPFILVNDSLLNRSFIAQYSYPIILGIEEHLGNTMLSYLNEMGYVSFGFESGQHHDPGAITNALEFIQNTLELTNSIPKNLPLMLAPQNQSQGEACTISGFFEIYHQHKIAQGETFRMIQGFRNFEHVPAGVKLATSNSESIFAKKNVQLFMPLYQERGSSGFYFIKRIPKFFLHLSKWLRISRSDRFLVLMPGIKWGSENRDTLLIDLKIARFLARQIFHLLGYRTRILKGNTLIAKNRERGSRNRDYAKEPWF